MRIWGIVVALAAVAGLVGGVYWMTLKPPYDPDFDAGVTTPAYRVNGPIVLFDEGHHNAHSISRTYKPFAELIGNDGYRVRAISERISSNLLSGAVVLVIVCARGANDAGDGPAFGDDEAAAIEAWVRAGGSLLLVTDHWPFGAAAAPLALRFGVSMSGGFAEDSANFEKSLESSHLVFSRDNALLKDHPITNGRNADEYVRRVLTFTGQSIWGPPEAGAFLSLADTALDSPPGAPKVERRGGDVIVSMDYRDPVSAKGRAQGLALSIGNGRVVVLGEAAMISAQLDGKGRPAGMNFPGIDNRKLTLNIMHWLSRLM